MTPAHTTTSLAELVCSNSLGSDVPSKAGGVLKSELRSLGSFVLACADEVRVPAGGALAVDRTAFSDLITSRIEGHPAIRLRREEMTTIPDEPTVIATGPLTSSDFADEIARLIGSDYLFFYDALAPILARDSVDMSLAFAGSRYGRGDNDAGDYINCPLSKTEYDLFVNELCGADRIVLRDFEAGDPQFFEGCLPIEVMATRGATSLAFGPMRPVGLVDPRTGRRPYAVVQLRQDNAAGTLYNIVGFQTNLRWPEQARVIRLIPGLQNAHFVRFGQMHRNTFINSPRVLKPTMQFKGRDNLFFAGQLTGVEGYAGNAAMGLLAGINMARCAAGLEAVELPHETMIGALAHYVTSADSSQFQPMKANFGLLPDLDDPIRDKQLRYRAYAERSLKALGAFARSLGPASGERAQSRLESDATIL
jgi:methylenetetrahydrofolate--tRNA-(uracil-5-)-methyltransferase